MKRAKGIRAAAFLLCILGGCDRGCQSKATVGNREEQRPMKNAVAELDVQRLLELFGPPPSDPRFPDDDATLVLDAFATAGPVTELPAGGEDIWFGKSYDVDTRSNGIERWFFLRIRHDPPSQRARAKAGASGAEVLPCEIYLNTLRADSIWEDGDARELFFAGKRGQEVHPKNQALPFIRKAVALGGYHPLARAETSLVVLGERRGYLRQKGPRLLYIELAPSASLTPPYNVTGRFAELWQVKEPAPASR